MPSPSFYLQILSETRCVLRRDGAEEEQEFRNVQAALQYAQALPDTEGSRVQVHDEKGQLFMHVTL